MESQDEQEWAPEAPQTDTSYRSRLFRAGDRVAGYELTRLLGEGGMGQVWLARRKEGYQKEVALKLIFDEGDARSATEVQGLLNEARACLHVRHANLVDVYDVGRDRHVHYMAMACVDGWAFDSILNELRNREALLPAAVVVELGIAICRGLAAAHGARDENGQPLGLVHRDMKPANLMLDRSGVIKVMDFGIARSQSNIDRTRTGVIKGSPGYMSPEQWKGSEAIGPQSDLFSLGLVLCELISGQRVIEAPNPYAALFMLQESTPEENSRAAAARFPVLDPLLTRLLARDPAERPESAEQLALELASVRRQLPSWGGLAELSLLLAGELRLTAEEFDVAPEDWRQLILAWGDDSTSISTALEGQAGPPPQDTDATTVEHGQLGPDSLQEPATHVLRTPTSEVPRLQPRPAELPPPAQPARWPWVVGPIGLVLLVLLVLRLSAPPAGDITPTGDEPDRSGPTVNQGEGTEPEPGPPDEPDPTQPEHDPDTTQEDDPGGTTQENDPDGTTQGDDPGDTTQEDGPGGTTGEDVPDDTQPAGEPEPGDDGSARGGTTRDREPPTPEPEPPTPEPSPTPTPLPPTPVRFSIRGNAFRLALEGPGMPHSTFEMDEARSGIMLVPGDYRATFFCLDCGAGEVVRREAITVQPSENRPMVYAFDQ